LTEMGYLRQPHTSAGRFRRKRLPITSFSRLIQDTTLPDKLRSTISHQFHQMRNDIDQWMRLAASVLAHQSQAASLVTAPHPAYTLLKHVELISTRGQQVLMIMVMLGGELRQEFFTVAEPVTQEELSAAANHLTGMLQNRNPEEIKALTANLDWTRSRKLPGEYMMKWHMRTHCWQVKFIWTA